MNIRKSYSCVHLHWLVLTNQHKVSKQTNNRLRLNADQTDLIIIGTSRQCCKLTLFFPTPSLIIASHGHTLYLFVVLHLVVILISEKIFLWFCCLYHIHDLHCIHPYISLSVAKTFATALITSRLDYCNSLLDKIASKDIAKLQYVQNCLARIVTWSTRFSHSEPLLKSFHWLPVKFSMLSLASRSRGLRSSGFHFLTVPRDKTHAAIAFSVAVPSLWNSLPEYVKSSNSIVSFCHHLKTHLFRLAFFLSFLCIRSFVDKFCIVP